MIPSGEGRDLALLAMGAALVDVLERVAHGVPTALGLRQGQMTLADADTVRKLYAGMGDTHAASGGSAANTAAALGRLGVRTAFAGKAADDQFGEIFGHDLRAAGVEQVTAPLVAAPDIATGRVLVLVTPDGERTMCTNLGAARYFAPADAETAGIERARVLYLESYLLEEDTNRAAFLRAYERARDVGTAVALSLSDPGCVERHGECLRQLLAAGVEVLFANEQEIRALVKAGSHGEAVEAVRGRVGLAALTRGAKGVVAVRGDETAVVPAEPVSGPLDTTGAGDMFAAGFLYGVLEGCPLATCARMGTVMAAEVLNHLGARPEEDPRPLLAALD